MSDNWETTDLGRNKHGYYRSIIHNPIAGLTLSIERSVHGVVRAGLSACNLQHDVFNKKIGVLKANARLNGFNCEGLINIGLYSGTDPIGFIHKPALKIIKGARQRRSIETITHRLESIFEQSV